MEIASFYQVDRNVLTVTNFDEAENDDVAYWHSRTFDERLAYMEYLRWLNHGDETFQRLQRVLEVVEFIPN